MTIDELYRIMHIGHQRGEKYGLVISHKDWNGILREVREKHYLTAFAIPNEMDDHFLFAGKKVIWSPFVKDNEYLIFLEPIL